MVASLEVPQKFCPARSRGSKNLTTGFNFPAKASRSALDSAAMEALVKLAPLEVDGAKAAAEPAKREARSNFIVNCCIIGFSELRSLGVLTSPPTTRFWRLSCSDTGQQQRR